MSHPNDRDPICNDNAADRRAEEVHAACLPEATNMSDWHDEADYREWCREYENGRWEARIAEEAALEPARDGPAPRYSFVQKLFNHANDLLDSDDSDLRGLAEEIAEIAHLARHLEASSWEQFCDRRDCLRDSKI